MVFKPALVLALQQDAILRVTSTAICGSDLHMYTGAMPGMTKGDLLGHEVRVRAHSSDTCTACCRHPQLEWGHRPAHDQVEY